MTTEYGGEEHSEKLQSQLEDMLHQILDLSGLFETKEECSLFLASLALAVKADVVEAGGEALEMFGKVVSEASL